MTLVTKHPGASACGICALIERVASGQFADTVAELPHSWIILGDAQFYRGYCVMLAKRHVTELHLFERADALALFDELMALGEAISNATNPLKLNYECLGNQQPHVHWHVFPRQAHDSRHLEPVWTRPESERKVRLSDADRRSLVDALRGELNRLLPGLRLR
ncbi:MAG: HIT family protein [Candidatus Binataceae bacterium]